MVEPFFGFSEKFHYFSKVANVPLCAGMPKPQLVSVGSKVVVRNAATIRILTITHGTGDPATQTISKSSPLGRALLGHQPSDQILVEAPSGRQMYEIVDVL